MEHLIQWIMENQTVSTFIVGMVGSGIYKYLPHNGTCTGFHVMLKTLIRILQKVDDLLSASEKLVIVGALKNQPAEEKKNNDDITITEVS